MKVGKIAARGADRLRRRGREVPVVLGVDLEPDGRTFPPDEPRPWAGFEQLAERMPALRERLAEVNGAPIAFTWFLRMDPQVERTWGSASWVAERYANQLAALREAGDELALHTHTWRIDEEANEWFADYMDPAWAEECLDTGFQAYEHAFGEPCRIHRFGDHFMTGRLLGSLEQRGVIADFSLEPGWPPVGPSDGERWEGLLPDFRDVPAEPYRSSEARFPAPADEEPASPLLVPLFSPPAMRRRQRLPLPPDSKHFVSRLAFELSRRTPSLMALVMRSDMTLEHWERIERNLEHLARHPGMRFVTATSAVEQEAR